MHRCSPNFDSEGETEGGKKETNMLALTNWRILRRDFFSSRLLLGKIKPLYSTTVHIRSERVELAKHIYGRMGKFPAALFE